MNSMLAWVSNPKTCNIAEWFAKNEENAANHPERRDEGICNADSDLGSGDRCLMGNSIQQNARCAKEDQDAQSSQNGPRDSFLKSPHEALPYRRGIDMHNQTHESAGTQDDESEMQGECNANRHDQDIDKIVVENGEERSSQSKQTCQLVSPNQQEGEQHKGQLYAQVDNVVGQECSAQVASRVDSVAIQDPATDAAIMRTRIATVRTRSAVSLPLIGSPAVLSCLEIIKNEWNFLHNLQQSGCELEPKNPAKATLSMAAGKDIENPPAIGGFLP
jgi:hypothetical protein